MIENLKAEIFVLRVQVIAEKSAHAYVLLEDVRL